MDNLSETEQKTRASKIVSISLFPKHDTIIRAFAGQDNRSYSNATQTIIEQWAREHGYGHLLLEEELAA